MINPNTFANIARYELENLLKCIHYLETMLYIVITGHHWRLTVTHHIGYTLCDSPVEIYL